MYLVCALQTSYTNTTPLVAGGGLLSIIAQIFQWIGLIQHVFQVRDLFAASL